MEMLYEKGKITENYKPNRIVAAKKCLVNYGKPVDIQPFFSIREHAKDTFSQDPECSIALCSEYFAVMRKIDNTFAIYDTNTFACKAVVAFHQVILSITI